MLSANEPAKSHAPLIDEFGRVHTALRISVTDRCNIRCFYCMPNEAVQFKPRSELLTFEEIERFVQAIVPLGVTKLRLTGGEPLLRAELPELVRRLANIPGVTDLALTTNGMILEQQAQDLHAAGLRRLNISLDTLNEATFLKISRRSGLDRVLAGIEAARGAGFEKIRLNAVSLVGISEAEVVPLVQFAGERGMEMRFIEFMPLDAEHHWQTESVLTGAMVRQIIEDKFGPLTESPRTDPSQPAVDFTLADTQTVIGFINPVSEPFCGDCNRLRLTAEGQLRNCLFSEVEWDARRLLRRGADDEELETLIRHCVAAKKRGHGIDSPAFLRPERAMYQIGG
jgi:cyclic pyranopterin phosphate synthase